MSDVKVNKLTGQIAVPTEVGFKVYEKGQYKQNSITGEYAVPSDDGQWHVFAGPSMQPDDRRGESTGLMQPEQPGYGDQVMRQLGLTARYAAEGITGLPAMVGDAANSVVNYGIKGVNEVAGTQIPYLQKPTEMIQKGLDAAGAPKPENTTERIVSYPSRALASIVPTAALGNAAKAGPEAVKGLEQLAEGLAPQAGGAVGGGLAQGATAEVTDNPVLQALAAIAGGAAGGWAAGRTGQASQAEDLPTTRDLKAAAQAQFQAADDAGAILKPEPIQRLTQGVIDDATQFGYLPALHPRIGAVIQELERVNSGNITTKGIMTLRRVANNAAKSADPSEQALGSQIINRIDDMMETIGPDDVVQGDIETAATSWANARDLWGRFRKSEKIDKTLKKADRQAQKSGTGGNTDNALRQRISAILDNDKARRGFTKDEIATMEAIVKGSRLTNTLRNVGKFSPTAGMLPAAFSITAAGLGGAPGMAVPVAGLTAKVLADRSTRSGIKALSELIRAGGRYAEPSLPAANQALPNALMGVLPNVPNATLPPDKRALIQRLIAQ